MPKAGPRKIANCGDRFKATAVKLNSLPGVRVKDVAAALDIHPFLLSLWRKQVREKVIVARASKLDVETTAELRRLRELERRYKVLRARALEKSHPVCFESKAEIFEFIEVNRAQHKITTMCRLYGVTRAGFYAWRSRGRSRCELRNDSLAAQIRTVQSESRGTYGSPRVHRTLQGRGHRIGKHQVVRLLRRHGIKARVATIRYTSPGLQHFYGSIANQQLDLKLERPDQAWVGDITYLKVGSLYRYLAAVMDKYSRRVIRGAYGPHKDVPPTLRALNRAVRTRKPGPGVVFHTDRGTEYAAGDFKKR